MRTAAIIFFCQFLTVYIIQIFFLACSVVEALEAASLHPAEALNIADKKGTLNYGADADFLLLTPELDLLSTWIAGECVYQSEKKLS